MNKTKNKSKMLVFTLIVIVSLGSLACAQDKKIAEDVNSAQPARIKNAVIPVEGMMCMSCVSRVKRKLNALGGVDSVTVNLEGKTASFTYDKGQVDIEEIRQAINDLGYTAGEPQTKDNDL